MSTSTDVVDALARDFDAAALDTCKDPHGDREWPLVAPDEPSGFAALFALAAERGWKVLPLGAGSKLAWTRPLGHVDVALSTRRFAGVLAYEPGDGTVLARAGTRMEALGAAVLEGGHDLAPDVPRAHASTLGGVIAAGQSGRDRLRHGSVRDQVLGLRVMTPDGSCTKTGGQLVKNVTGYDLHKLYTGSFGSLCLILEGALRLAPRPPLEAWITARARRSADAGGPHAAALRLVRASLSLGKLALRPRAVAVLQGADGVPVLYVHLVGEARPIAWELGEVARFLGSQLDGLELESGSAAERVTRPVGFEDGERLESRAHVACYTRPTEIEDLWTRVQAAAEGLGRAVALAAHPLVGSLSFSLPGSASEADVWAAPIEDLRRELAPRGARIFLRNGSARLAGRVEPLGAPGPELALMQRLRHSYDPGQLLAGPRLFPGL